MGKMPLSRAGLIALYDKVVGNIDAEASDGNERAYGGVVRAGKGKLVETMAEHIVMMAWHDVGGLAQRLSFHDVKKYQIHVSEDYVETLSSEIARHIGISKNQHSYRAHVDKHVFVDGRIVLGIECKAYTENAMLKRILVDFRLLKSLHPGLHCCLLQLESMLGGDYAYPLASSRFGSPSSHVLMSFFPEVKLNIVTLLEGERHVKKPIHDNRFFKPLKPAALDRAIEQFGTLLEPWV